MYRIQQFASLAGVTVRTLHHYDRLGLLKPRHRSEAGYRLYVSEDLAYLERILVLRYLGLPLREIAVILHASPVPEESLHDTLVRQASVLRQRRDGIERVLRAIDFVRQQLSADPSPDWSLYQLILKEIHMQESTDWSRKYYSPSAQQAVDEHAREWNPDMQAKVTTDWNAMFARVEDAIARNVPPASPEGKALATEWMALVGQFTRGNPEILAGLNKLYADRENWPAEKQQNPVKPELIAFIRAAQAG